ncbi:rhodanese-like domain-containing protein [Desulfovibrio sp.]|uniref:rhodanese-like domain-containing protein n=1 Tax=Desulfovibrio sp. TaxID=885 RepID=UPI002A35A4CC|nr:rhodanese-like domain-containing protein [Desulfovibrio sp.]MDY0260342.1 rhodanese-like domain-containing protein [Desulfovibrio sp.]
MKNTHHSIPRHMFRLLALLMLVLLAVPALARDISVQDAAALLQNPPQGLVIVDVRTPAEFREGHLPGAVNMDYFGGPFETQIQSLPKTAPVLLYCRTGNRSGSAYDVMTKAGIGNILHMNEGITKWQQLGLPQEK